MPSIQKIKGYWPAILWAVFILILTIIPKDNIPETEDWGLSLDKLVHFALFAVLIFLILKGGTDQVQTWKNGQLLWIALGLIIYGLLMETLQLIIPDRSFSLADLLADGLGVLAGGIYFIKFYK